MTELAARPSPPRALATWITPVALTVLCIAGFYIRLLRAWDDIRTIVVKTAPDDAFYYFQIARNITHGQGATLDGETVTSGFHPLWLFLTLPIFAIDDRQLAVSIALTVCAALSAVTTLLVFHIVMRLVANPRAGLLAAGVFAFHPVVITNGVNGLETPLTLLLLAGTILSYLHIWQGHEGATVRNFALLGVLGGLLVLARTDMLAAYVCMLAALAIRARTLGPRGPILAASITALFVLPWVAWCAIATGSPLQDSAVAGGQMAQNLRFLTHEDSLGPNLSHGLNEIRDTLFERLPQQFLVPIPDATAPYLVALAAVLATVALVPTSRRGETWRALGVLAVPFVGVTLVLVASAGLRWYVAHWYYAPFGLLLACSVGLLVHYLEGVLLDIRVAVTRDRQGTEPHAWRDGVTVAALYVVLVAVFAWHFRPANFSSIWYQHWWQADQYDAALWMRSETAADARIGAFNAGIPAYFSERTVVNLDGVMNREAYEALRDCRTREFIRDAALDYVSDTQTAFTMASCGLTLGEDLVVEATIGTVIITRPERPPQSSRRR